MRMSFESAFGLALLLISVGLIAGPYVSGEETLASLVHNKLALFGAAALLLFVVYRIAAAIKEVTTPKQTETSSTPLPKLGEAAALVASRAVGTEKSTFGLNGQRVVADNTDEPQREQAS